MRVDASHGGEKPTYLIDGYNVIRRDKQLRTIEDERGLEEGRNTLLRRIVDSRRLANARVIVVFDGASEAVYTTSSHYSGVEVRFSLYPQNADQRIVSIVKLQRDSSSIFVVTADRDLQWEVKKLGARVVDPDDFISDFATRRRPKTESTDKPIANSQDVSWGLATFGDEIMEIEAVEKTRSLISPEVVRTSNVEARNLTKERNKQRYLRRTSRKRS